MPVETPGSLAALIRTYHVEFPDAKPDTVRGWKNAVRLAHIALKRQPMVDDLTTDGLSTIEGRLFAADYSRFTISNVTKVLNAFWRFVSDRGEAVETAPKRRMDSRGRMYLEKGRCRLDFDSFAVQVGLKAVRKDDLPAAHVLPSLNLPTIQGPRRQDFDQYRNEIETGRKTARADLRRLFGVMLFNWAQLYMEWAGIAGKARNQWRFALVRFGEYLERAPQIDDLTAENLAGMEAALSGNQSASHVVKKLRAVWRFAWEVGAIEDGPPIKEGSWRAQRWTMHRLGRPSVKVSS